MDSPAAEPRSGFVAGYRASGQCHEDFFNSTNGGFTTERFILVPRISTVSGADTAAVATNAEPIASLSMGDNVPETTRPTAAPFESSTGVSARTIRRSPVLKNTI